MPENKDRLLQEVINEDFYREAISCVSSAVATYRCRNPQKPTRAQSTQEAFEVPGLKAHTIEEANTAGGSGSSEFYTKQLKDERNS